MELVSILPPGHRGRHQIAVTVGDTFTGEVGDIVTLASPLRVREIMKVAGIHQRTLAEIDYTDLTGFVHADPRVFWNRLESSLGCGQPAETLITFVTLSPDLVGEAADEEDVEPEKTPSKWALRKLRFSDED
jgi:hypothetical protein